MHFLGFKSLAFEVDLWTHECMPLSKMPIGGHNIGAHVLALGPCVCLEIN